MKFFLQKPIKNKNQLKIKNAILINHDNFNYGVLKYPIHTFNKFLIKNGLLLKNRLVLANILKNFNYYFYYNQEYIYSNYPTQK